MKTLLRQSRFGLLGLALLAAGLMLGCDDRDEARTRQKSKDKPAETKKVAVAKNISLEVLPDKKRRVLLTGEVCLREGQLELLMCRKQTKEHEAILTADVDAARSMKRSSWPVRSRGRRCGSRRSIAPPPAPRSK